MSTVYPPRFIKYALSSKKERNAATLSANSMVSGNYGHFPDSFTLYYAGPGTDFLSQRFYLRDNSEELKKIYAIHYHKGPGTAQLTLYSTDEHTPPVLAISASEKRFSSNVRVTAPPPPSSRGGAGQFVDVKYTSRGKAHSFTVPAVTENHQRNQDGYDDSKRNNGAISNVSAAEKRFEWREGSRIKPKLRQLFKLPQPGSGEAEELIATWKEGSVPNSQGRLAGFEFTSTVARDQLGEYGTLIAVSSLLSICAIMGTAIDGAAAWQEEKALEKSYHPGYWEEEGSHPTYQATATTWSDPWMKAGASKEDS